jgi:uncharacterized protein with HEPN domain
MRARAIRVRLADIRVEISGIRELTREASREAFAASWAMKRARAAHHCGSCQAHPTGSESRAAVGALAEDSRTGNLLRHEYRRIDPDILWSVIVDHLDDLDQATAALLESHHE